MQIAKASGGVEIGILVNERGIVESASVKKRTGNKSLDESTIKSLKKWSIKPATDKEGKRVPNAIVIPIRFALGGLVT